MTLARARAGAARAHLAALTHALRDEALSALLAGHAARSLRELHAPALFGKRSLAALLEEQVPALDRTSARLLLQIGDLTAEAGDIEQLASLGLHRLAVIAAAAPAQRAVLLGVADTVPVRELRRIVRDADDAAQTAQLRGASAERQADPFAPQGPASPDASSDATRAAAGEQLAALASSWRELTDHAYTVARALLAFADDGHWADYGDTPADAAEMTVGLPPSSIDRARALVERTALVPLAARHAAGIRALRALADLDAEARRSELIDQLRSAPLSAEALLRSVRARPLAPTTPGALDQPDAAWVDDPDAIGPFNVWFCADPPADAPPFVDATSADLVGQLLLRTTKPGDAVLDLTAGVGTVARVGRAMGRRVTSYDLIDPPLDPTVEVGDARRVDPDTGPFALIVVHPPLPGGTHYTERYAGRAAAGDLSGFAPDDYERALGEILTNARRQLAPDGTLALIVRESRWSGRLIDWPARLGVRALRAGWLLRERIFAVSPLAERATALRSGGYAARRRGEAISAVTSVLLLSIERSR